MNFVISSEIWLYDTWHRGVQSRYTPFTYLHISRVSIGTDRTTRTYFVVARKMNTMQVTCSVYEVDTESIISFKSKTVIRFIPCTLPNVSWRIQVSSLFVQLAHAFVIWGMQSTNIKILCVGRMGFNTKKQREDSSKACTLSLRHKLYTSRNALPWTFDHHKHVFTLIAPNEYFFPY